MSRELEGCGDHSCWFAPPEGIGTNGGCHCVEPHMTSGERLVLQRKIKKLRYALLDAERGERYAIAASDRADRKIIEIDMVLQEIDPDIAEDIRNRIRQKGAT